MGPINTDGLVPALITLGAIIVLILWGFWKLIDWAFIDDAIRVDKPIIPELELVVKDNKVDTVYVYRIP